MIQKRFSNESNQYGMYKKSVLIEERIPFYNIANDPKHALQQLLPEKS